MKTMHFHTCLFGAVLLAAPLACDPEPAAAPQERPRSTEPLRLLPIEGGDVAAPAVTGDAAPVSDAVDREPVALSWPTDQSADDLDARPAPHRADSRAFWQLVDPAALASGVALPISEPGALIKLSPQDGLALDLAALELVGPDGVAVAGVDALKPLADPEHMKAAGVAFSPGTAIYTVRRDLGGGAFTLRGQAAGRVLVYVLEKGSAAVLSLAPGSDLAFSGARVPVTVQLRDGEAVLEASSIAGALVSPDGERTPFALARAEGGSYRGDVVAPARRGPPGALYTVEVDAAAITARGLPVRRIATGALALSPPTARYSGPAQLEPRRDGGLRVALSVEVGAASRYGASALLYGTNRDGALQPIGVAQSARWLEPGDGALTLEFDAATLTAGGLRAPYELRDLRLVDQGRIHVLHRQARALALVDGAR
jgi:hypothetical protein